MKTYAPKPDHVQRRWYVLDADGQVLGRLATQVASLLRGKHKPVFAPHMDTGDHVIVVNADKVELTGNKRQTKIAYRHSGYPGGIRATTYERLLAERPVAAVEKAVRGMLPKNRLGRAMIRKLHVVAGPEHPHAAQTPTVLAASERPVWEGLPVPSTADASRPAATTRAASSRPAATKRSGSTSKPKGTAAAASKKSTATSSKATGGAKRSSAKPASKATSSKSTARTTKSTAKRSTAKRSTSSRRPKDGS